MSRESIMRWAETTGNRKPRPYYVTGPARFGPDGYDCSGFTYMAYLRGGGLTIPADSASVAKWGRSNGQVRSVGQARYADLMVHDKYGDIYASIGPRGHIGLFDHFSNGRVICWESSGFGDGVAPISRPMDWWDASVQHPAFAGSVPSTPAPQEDEDLTPDQDNRLKALEMLAVKHDDMLGWICSALMEGGYEKRAPDTLRLPKVASDVKAIKGKVGA